MLVDPYPERLLLYRGRKIKSYLRRAGQIQIEIEPDAKLRHQLLLLRGWQQRRVQRILGSTPGRIRSTLQPKRQTHHDPPYNEDIIREIIGDTPSLVEQRSRTTAQFVLRNHASQ